MRITESRSNYLDPEPSKPPSARGDESIPITCASARLRVLARPSPRWVTAGDAARSRRRRYRWSLVGFRGLGVWGFRAREHRYEHASIMSAMIRHTEAAMVSGREADISGGLRAPSRCVRRCLEGRCEPEHCRLAHRAPPSERLSMSKHEVFQLAPMPTSAGGTRETEGVPGGWSV